MGADIKNLKDIANYEYGLKKIFEDAEDSDHDDFVASGRDTAVDDCHEGKATTLGAAACRSSLHLSHQTPAAVRRRSTQRRQRDAIAGSQTLTAAHHYYLLPRITTTTINTNTAPTLPLPRLLLLTY
jgi:hypothetical protein